MLMGMAKPMPSKPPDCGFDGAVDADHFAADVDERPAAVALIDGGVGLQETRQGMLAVAQIAALGADDARRDAALESEWRADGDGPLTHLYSVGVADGGERAACGWRRSG